MSKARDPMVFKVLSVDWDYFFPNVAAYDWSMSETRHAALFHEGIWVFRAYERRMCDYRKENAPRAIHLLRVDKEALTDFRHGILTKSRMGRVLKLYVCESHANIWTLMRSTREQILELGRNCVFDIWNVDAHHDWFYDLEPKPGQEPDCGNWAFQGKREGFIRNYRLIYPPWRKEGAEGGFARVEADSVTYGLREEALPSTFDFAFFCRSGAWTPPWDDLAWELLLESLSHVMPRQWKDKAFVAYSLAARDFDKEAAFQYHENCKKRHDEMLGEMESKKESEGDSNSIGLLS